MLKTAAEAQPITDKLILHVCRLRGEVPLGGLSCYSLLLKLLAHLQLEGWKPISCIYQSSMSE